MCLLIAIIIAPCKKKTGIHNADVNSRGICQDVYDNTLRATFTRTTTVATQVNRLATAADVGRVNRSFSRLNACPTVGSVLSFGDTVLLESILYLETPASNDRPVVFEFSQGRPMSAEASSLHVRWVPRLICPGRGVSEAQEPTSTRPIGNCAGSGSLGESYYGRA